MLFVDWKAWERKAICSRRPGVWGAGHSVAAGSFLDLMSHLLSGLFLQEPLDMFRRSLPAHMHHFFHLSLQKMMSCSNRTLSHHYLNKLASWVSEWGQFMTYAHSSTCEGCNYGVLGQWKTLAHNFLTFVNSNSPCSAEVAWWSHLSTGIVLRVTVYPASQVSQCNKVMMLLDLLINNLGSNPPPQWEKSQPCVILDVTANRLIPQFVILSRPVPHHRRRALRPAHGHRAGAAGGQGGGDREERLLLSKQRAAPLALHHSRPARPGG